MRKTLLGALVPVAAMAGMFGAGTAQADETPNQSPTLADMNEQWNEGGAAIGGGAFQAVSAAWVGIPAQAMFVIDHETGMHDAEFVTDEG